ncbi:MAG: hypothetical protein ACOH5I_22170 [Oligoflexus sp.]
MMLRKFLNEKFHKISSSSQFGVALSLLGVVGWSLAIIVTKFFSLVFQTYDPINWFHMAVIPLFLIATSVTLNYFELHRKFKVQPISVTMTLTGLHGIWGLYVAMHVHPSYNGYLILFLFSYGMLYLKISFGFIGTLVFSGFILLLALLFIFLLDINFGTDEAVFVIFFIFHGIGSSLLNEFNRRKNLQLKREINLRRHSHEQLAKVFFPHQLQRISDGNLLESTMPVEQGFGACLLFEIIDSDKIQHEMAQKLLREIFAKFSLIARENYDATNMQSNAFRIIELNNRFVCTVGFPFRCPDSQRPSMIALQIARKFIEVFHKEIDDFDYPQPIHCSVAIASGAFEGFYTHGFPIEYHVYGAPLAKVEVLNEARKNHSALISSGQSVIIIQDRVFNSLNTSDRQGFTVLTSQNPSNIIYYAIFDPGKNSVAA